MSNLYVIEKKKVYPDVYKNFYICQLFKIYNDTILRNPQKIIFEMALPFLYYLKCVFEKTDFVKFKFSFGLYKENAFYAKTPQKHQIPYIQINIFRTQLKIFIGKNYLCRTTNIYNNASIDRYFSLQGKYINNIQRDIEDNPFRMLMMENKYLQFKHLMKYLNIKDFISDPDNWIFASKIAPKTGFNIFLCQLAKDMGIEIKAYKDDIIRDKEAEDAYVQENIRVWREKLLTKEANND